jgi:serine/threonine protein kinase
VNDILNKDPPLIKNIDEEIFDFILKLLSKDPEERLDLISLLHLPIFKKTIE